MTTSTDAPVKLTIENVADTPTLLGREFRTGWFKIDEEKLEEFDSATYTDQNQFSVVESAYPEDLIEGFHLVSLLDYLVNGVLHVTGPWVAWNYGIDKVRFINPTRAADRWRVHGKVVDIVQRSGGYVLHLELTSEIEGQDDPGFFVKSLVLWRDGSL